MANEAHPLSENVAEGCGVSPWMHDEDTQVYQCIDLVGNVPVYTGITTVGFEVRRKQHLDPKGYNGRLTRAIAKYGESRFVWKIFPERYTWELACVIETILIAEARHVFGASRIYNLSAGGEGVRGVIRSPETRAKIAIASKRVWADPEYAARQAARFKAVASTPEARAKNRERAREVMSRPGFKEKQLATTREALARPEAIAKHYLYSLDRRGKPGGPGKSHTPETREKLAAGRRGKRVSPEQKAKTSAFQKAFWTEAMRFKCSLATRQGMSTPEARTKMSAAQRKRWAAMSPEERSAYGASRAASLVAHLATQEGKAKRSAAMSKRWANMSPEKRTAITNKIAATKRRKMEQRDT